MTTEEEMPVTINLQSRATVQPAQMWKSCCFYIDPQVLRFTIQCVISGTVMVFCIYKLTLNLNCSQTQFYTGMITFLTGVFLPAPRI